MTVDCAAQGLGTQLDSYRSTVKATRDSLKEYHKALVDLVSAMNASGDKPSSDDSSADDTTNDNTDSADDTANTDGAEDLAPAPPTGVNTNEEAINESN